MNFRRNGGGWNKASTFTLPAPGHPLPDGYIYGGPAGAGSTAPGSFPGSPGSTPGITPQAASRLLQFVKPPNPAGWQTYDISSGTSSVGTPSIVWGDTKVVFGIRADGALVQWSQPPGTGVWSTSQITAPGSVSGGVSAVNVGGDFAVFASG